MKNQSLLNKKRQVSAEIGALLAETNLNSNYRILRLSKDLKELKSHEDKFPLIGISAFPINNKLEIWHANIKNIASKIISSSYSSNYYKGIIFHLELVFPENYPLKPPKVKLLNYNSSLYSHPSVNSNGEICLDMLNPPTDTPYSGWTSNYSVYSILLQLQIFFNENYVSSVSDKENISKINNYKCSCGHNGTINICPEIKYNEELNNEKSNALFKTSKSIANAENIQNLQCAIKKISFDESPLGYGVSINKLQRTGEIKALVISQELISLKAFTKQKIRKIGFSNKIFTKWFPIFFGINSNKDQILHLTKRAISLITTGTTKNYDSNQALVIYPKLFNTLIADMINPKINYMQVKSLQILIQVYRSFRILLQSEPELQSKLNTIIDDFIQNPIKRIKDNSSSLGDILFFTCFTSGYKLNELINPYMDESLDRSIYWSLSLIPDLDEILKSTEGDIEDSKLKALYKAGSSGFVQFYYYFIKNILKKDSKIPEKYDEYLDIINVLLDENECYIHLKAISSTLKIDNYIDLYKFFDIKISKSEISLKLKQSYSNSLAKKYHGDIDEARYVPEDKDQIKIELNKFNLINKLKESNEKQLKLTISSIKNDDLIWKSSCISDLEAFKKFSFSKNCPSKLYSLNQYEFLSFYENDVKKNIYFKKEFNDESSFNYIKENYNTSAFDSFSLYETSLLKSLSWKEIYIKVYLEFYIRFFNHIQDFTELYSILDAFSPEVKHLNFYIGNVSNLKSDYNYIRVILSKLVHIKYIRFIYTNKVEVKLIKNILKGLCLFNNQGGEIEGMSIIYYQNSNHPSNQEYNLLSVLNYMKGLKHMDLSNVYLNNQCIINLRNHLYNHKSLITLKLKGIKLNDSMAKELSDGLMRAKNLESIDLSYSETKKGLSNILYNFSFLPVLKHLIISNCSNGIDIPELVISLFKLMKMSTSIESIYMNNIPLLTSSLSEDFFKTLGEISSLKLLDMSNSDSINKVNIGNLGKAVAFNYLKGGSLKYLNLSGTLSDSNLFNYFIESMNVSEDDHYKWYNKVIDSTLNKDKKEYYLKKFQCNLSFMDLSKNKFYSDININDIKNNKENPLLNFISNSKSLSTLIFDKSSLNINFISLISHALRNYPNNIKSISFSKCNLKGDLIKSLFSCFRKDEKSEQKSCCVVENLDVSNNLFGYLGISEVSDVLLYNNTLKTLNLYHNLFSIDGARKLGHALKLNTTLNVIDIGYNRIRDNGLKEIIENIILNKDSKIRIFSSRYNFLSDAIVNVLFEKIFNNQLKFEEVELLNNSSQKDLMKIYSKFFEYRQEEVLNKESFVNKKIYTDMFEKLYFSSQEKLNRTIWIPNISPTFTLSNLSDLISFTNELAIDNKYERIGIPLDMHIVRGRKTGFKKNNNKFSAFVEFIHPNSSNLMIKLSQLEINYLGTRYKVYKAGTRVEYELLSKINQDKDDDRKRRVQKKSNPGKKGRGGYRGKRG